MEQGGAQNDLRLSQVVCPSCGEPLSLSAPRTIWRFSLRSFCQTTLQHGSCPQCSLVYYPSWVTWPDGYDVPWVSDAGCKALPLRENHWVDAEVLQWYDALFTNSGVTASEFAEAWMAQLPSEAVALLQTDRIRDGLFFLYKVYIVLDYAHRGWLASLVASAQHGMPRASTRIRLKFTGRNDTKLRALYETLPRLTGVLRAAMDMRWLANHATICPGGLECASVLILDGNEKLCPHGCNYVETPASARQAPVFCNRACRRNSRTCGLPEHRAQDDALRKRAQAVKKAKKGRRFCGISLARKRQTVGRWPLSAKRRKTGQQRWMVESWLPLFAAVSLHPQSASGSQNPCLKWQFMLSASSSYILA